MEHPMLSSLSLVAKMLDCFPLAAALLIDLQVECVGCSMNKFCTLEDMCRHYELDLEHILSLIQEKAGVSHNNCSPISQ